MATKQLEKPTERTIEPTVEVSQPTQEKMQKGLGTQSTITLVIIGGVVLFFVGVGLGYAFGYNQGDSANNSGNRQAPTMMQNDSGRSRSQPPSQSVPGSTNTQGTGTTQTN